MPPFQTRTTLSFENISGIRGDFVRATRFADHGGANCPEGERDPLGGDIHGHVNHFSAADSEHGGGAGFVGEGDGKCALPHVTSVGCPEYGHISYMRHISYIPNIQKLKKNASAVMRSNYFVVETPIYLKAARDTFDRACYIRRGRLWPREGNAERSGTPPSGW